MNPKTVTHQFEGLGVDVQLSLQRDHLMKALQRIRDYAEPPEGPLEMSSEEMCNAYNALKDMARGALKTMPSLR